MGFRFNIRILYLLFGSVGLLAATAISEPLRQHFPRGGRPLGVCVLRWLPCDSHAGVPSLLRNAIHFLAYQYFCIKNLLIGDHDAVKEEE